MPEILWYFLGGLMVSAAVGFVFYFAIGGASQAATQSAFGGKTSPLWGRSFRLLMFLMILVGGLSTQWHGCGGYSDYKDVAADRRRMFQKSTEQVVGAIDYGRWFLIGAAGVGAITIAVLARRQ